MSSEHKDRQSSPSSFIIIDDNGLKIIRLNSHVLDPRLSPILELVTAAKAQASTKIKEYTEKLKTVKYSTHGGRQRSRPETASIRKNWIKAIGSQQELIDIFSGDKPHPLVVIRDEQGIITDLRPGDPLSHSEKSWWSHVFENPKLASLSQNNPEALEKEHQWWNLTLSPRIVQVQNLACDEFKYVRRFFDLSNKLDSSNTPDETEIVNTEIEKFWLEYDNEVDGYTQDILAPAMNDVRNIFKK